MKLPLASAVAAAALALTGLAGCSTGPSSSASSDTPDAATSAAADAFPVTIEHAFGTTTIKDEPKRVATVGYSDQDTVLSLGVVPVGATKIVWGGNDNGSTEWFDAKLAEVGGEQPVRYDESDGVPIDEIAKLNPDLIVGTYSGMTKKEYTKLSQIADVVPYPETPWATNWETSLEMVGKALGRTAKAEEVATSVKATMDATTEKYPQLKGATFVLGGIAATDTSKIDYVSPIDIRPQVLTQLGMENSPTVEKLSKGTESFYGTISAERAASLKADLFIAMFYDFAEADPKVLTEDPLLSKIPAIAEGNLMVADDPYAAQSLSTPTPLSLPYAMDHFVPGIAKALEGAGSGQG